MGKAERRKKDSNTAAYLKKNNVNRTTTACPRCHDSVGLGNAMLAHLNSCKGKRKGRKKAA